MDTRYFKMFALGLIVAAGCWTASPVSAEGSKMRGMSSEKHAKEFEKRKAKMFAELGLSEEQSAQLKANREAHRSQMKTLRKDIKAKREAMKEALQKPEVDEAGVRQIHSELKTLDAQQADLRLEGILSVRKILTPEQFQKFMERKHERMDRKGERRSKMKERLKDRKDRNE